MRKEQKRPAATTQPQDIAIFGFRLVITSVIAAWVLLQPGLVIDEQVFFLAFVVALIVNLVLLIMAMMPFTLPHTRWAVISGDMFTIGAFAWMTYPDPFLTSFLVAGLTIISHVRLGWQWGSINTVLGVLALLVAVLAVDGAPALSAALFQAYWPYGLLLLVVTLGVATILTMRDRQIELNTRNIRNEARHRMSLVKAMQERTMAITDMAHQLSSTLNYQLVLDAALNVGTLAMDNREVTSFVSIVMLYRPEDNKLYVETARGLSRADENRVVQGKQGLVGETLQLCEPIFSGSVREDPELRQFISLQRARSVVTVPLRAGYDNYGVIIFASQERFAFDERYQTFLQAIGIQTTIALQNAALYQNLADEKERIVEVEEEARRKLARDLHDGPTQSVSAIAMRMSVIQQMLKTQPEKVPKELVKIEDLARKTTSEIRGMMFTLRPLALESRGLKAALKQLAEKMDAIYDQQVDILVSSEAEAVMTAHQSGTLFYIIEEAVNNARKHAQSDVIRVRVTRYEDVLLVEVVDEGVGFDVASVGAGYEGRSSLGMVNLHERTELVDGTLTIESQPGEGTTVSVVLPIDPTGNNRHTEPSRSQATQRKQSVFKLTAIR